MTEQHWACVVTLGMVLAFIYGCIYIYAKHLKPAESFLQRFDSGWNKIRQARRAGEYGYVLSVTFFFMFKSALKPFMAGTTVFVSLVIVGNSPCTPPDSIYAKFAREAWDAFFLPWLEHLSPDTSVSPPETDSGGTALEESAAQN